MGDCNTGLRPEPQAEIPIAFRGLFFDALLQGLTDSAAALGRGWSLLTLAICPTHSPRRPVPSIAAPVRTLAQTGQATVCTWEA